MISSVTLCIGGSFDCAGAGSCCSIGSFVETREYLPRPVFVILPVICFDPDVPFRVLLEYVESLPELVVEKESEKS